MKQFLRSFFRQLFTLSEARGGKLSITYWASLQMKENRLDFDTVEDVFRHGRKVTTIVQDYQNYSVSLGFRWDDAKKCFLITSVRRYERESRKR